MRNVMRRFLPPLVLLTAAGSLLSGCGPRLDTYNRPYTWRPTGANLANIAAQAAYPRDLVVGEGSNKTDASSLVPAVVAVDAGAAPPSAGGGGSAGGGAAGGASVGGTSGGTP
jgi:type IV pilus biogenesis protein CpaD/CtpE